MADSGSKSTNIQENLDDFDEDWDDIIAMFEGDSFDHDEEFNDTLNNTLSEAESTVATYNCDKCEKVCKSKQGLTRHNNAKHVAKNHPSQPTPESKLHPSTFRKFVKDAASKLASDECYSDSTMTAFQHFDWTLDEAISSYDKIKNVISAFNGDGEKFYPSFYDIVCNQELFPRLNRKCARLLGFEVANHVLGHLSKKLCSPQSSNQNVTSVPVLTEKDKNIVTYLSGYVFHSLYKKLCRPTNKVSTEIKEKYLALLLSGKSTAETTRSTEIFTQSLDRGGLWILDPKTVSIFEEAERFFRVNVENSATEIDGKIMVSLLMKNSFILSSMSMLRSKCTEQVEKELSLNLLQDLLTLYIRTRTFSYVKQKRDKHRLDSKRQKMKSLRTSIKKASTSLDMGH